MNMAIALALSKLQKENSKTIIHTKYENIRHCKFLVDEIELERGMSTSYGACRFQSEDYMYQGGCAEKSMWGHLLITNPMICTLVVTRNRMVEGKCTGSGHCWTAHHMKLLHAGCLC
jgi:hypothetical protein